MKRRPRALYVIKGKDDRKDREKVDIFFLSEERKKEPRNRKRRSIVTTSSESKDKRVQD